jgi:TRAP-type C4-dicarboxylate transport system permease small subunit
MDETLVGRIVHVLARYTAIAGGTVLAIITTTTLISVIGRGLIPLGLSPVPGDYEIVEAGVLFAVFAFLPWTQLMRGHAVVAIVTDQFSVRINTVIVFIADLLMFGLAGFLAWRHWLGMLDKLQYMETTFILRLPIWWSYAASMLGAIVFVIVAAYCVVRSGAAMVSANPEMPKSGAAE